ncbi:MAG TPA: chemotaxis protein CheB [Flavisolibacter sp.]|nr:chemotaxis protein CheB [Flavisolibacter sp.]
MKKAKTQNDTEKKPFPLVAIGASAGGMEAFIELLQHLPNATGLSYVYVQHLDPSHESNLVHILGRSTEMPVIEAVDQVTIEPNHIYVIPPNRELSLVDGVIQVSARPAKPYNHMPINHFFTSVAERYKEMGIGIILSGTATDGTAGMKAIKLAGGLTFAQDDSAKFQSMPKSAVAEGAADLVLSPKAMAEELNKISQQKDVYYTAIQELNEEAIGNKDEDLLGILHLLHRSTGVDFSLYKMNTIKRRIIRRMMLYKLETLKDYAQYIKQHTNEINFLYQDLLINVTAFFRDEDSSDYLKKNLLPKIIKSKASNDPLRVWVPACSTGQEAYSLAMLIIEVLGDKAANTPVQLFATDLSETAINKARLGIYSKDDVIDIPPKRLQRFFTKIDGHYRIVKSLRDLCVFATHNIAKDPPFSRLDLISCCNLLIYLDNHLQKKLIATFHYSLNSNGYLILGKSETVGTSAYLFAQLDKKLKIYAKKKDATAKAMFEMSYRIPESEKFSGFGRRVTEQKIKTDEIDLDKAVENLILKKYTPASVIVNYDLDILQFRGSTGLYLEPAPGKASLNLMKMARQGLGFELRNVVHKAKKTGQPARKTGLEISYDNKMHKVAVEAIPLKAETEEDYYLVVFEEMETAPQEQLGNIKDRRVKQLEEELAALREDMRSIVEAQEAANEELQSANEEIVSSNEELQSINEELETSKEEIESSNEELITINQELQVRNEQLAEVQEYSEAVFTTIRESLLILDKDLRIKSANQAFYKTFLMREEEVEGRLLFELNNKQWNIPLLRQFLTEIIPSQSQFHGFEITHSFPGIGEKVMLLNARKLIQKMHRQHLILLAIEDITEHKQAQRIIAEREAWFRNMANNAPVMIWVTGIDKLCNFANRTFLEYRGIELGDIVGKPWAEDAHPDDLDRCLRLYEDSFNRKQPFEIEYRLKKHTGEYCNIFAKAKPNFTTEGQFTGYIGSCVELATG